MEIVKQYGLLTLAICFIVYHLWNQRNNLKQLNKFYSENVTRLRNSIKQAFKSVLSLLTISFCLAYTVSNTSSTLIVFLINSMPILATFLILWATSANNLPSKP